MLSKVIIGLSMAVVIACSANAQGVTVSAACKLTNTATNTSLYDGPCKVTQSQSGASTVFDVKMGSAESFLFAGVRGQSNWMHGPEPVQFTDLPNGGIFRWSTFALAVAQ